MVLPVPNQVTAHAPNDEALGALVKSVYTTATLNFFVNGTKISLFNPNPHWTLLDFIRSQHGLKGTKLGCGEGGCGACTVVLQVPDARNKSRLRHITVNACLYPLIGVEGKHVITVEGLGSVEHPHPLQERLAKFHGSQCGFCTPGIVMSIYAIIRNAFDQETNTFHLTEDEIEMKGHLDGNLCRCTGYKPILQAAKTFITEDLKGRLVKGISPPNAEIDFTDKEHAQASELAKGNVSCGRPGGCCRDKPETKSSLSDGKSSDSASETESLGETSISSQDDIPVSGAEYGKPMKSRESYPDKSGKVEGTKAKTAVAAEPPETDGSVAQFKPYAPGTEIIYPPQLKKHESVPICYGNEKKVWLRPTSLAQLLDIMAVYPSAKIVSGASEVQVEVRFKHSDFAVSVFVSDIEELNKITVPKAEADIQTMQELVVGANAPLTDLEEVCNSLYPKLGTRGTVLKAIAKQLRYFAGRQIRNAASIAGNIATASPISDLNPVLMAAGATVIAENVDGEVVLPMKTFFLAYRTTSLPKGGVIKQVRIPLTPFNEKEIVKGYKQAKRKDDDIAIVNAAFRVRLSDDGIVTNASLIYGGLAPVTIEAKKTGQALIGRKWFEQATLGAALKSLSDEFNLRFGVPGGMASYRRTLALSLFFRYWHEVAHDLGLGDVEKEIVEEIHRNISLGARDNHNPHEQRVVGKQLPHLSGLKHATGEAEYLDDMPHHERELYGALVMSQRAHAKLASIDWSPALESGLALGYIDHTSIPPEANIWGSVVKDEPFFAIDKVESHGQPIGLVYADTYEQAQAAARAVKVVYEDLPPILSIDEAIVANSFFPYIKELRKGAANPDASKLEDIWSTCDRIFEGESRVGGQEHFYLETHAAMAIPGSEDGFMEVWSTTQNTMEVQEFVAQVLGVPSNKVNSRVKRMGGGFGGKESRPVQLSCLLAIAAKKEKRPVRCMLNRDEDMMTTGQRHPIMARWKVGCTNDGKLLALQAFVYNNAGYSHDMSGAVMDRCQTHLENCYQIPNVWIKGHLCKTNTHSNTAYRGFGGPQGMYIAECFMNAVAEGLNMDVDELRWKNLYKQGERTPFLQEIDQDWHVPQLVTQLKEEANYEVRKAAVAKFNAEHKYKKRGICLIPTKFGLSFATALHLNQATANIKVYADGSILLNHGGTEMGQGLYTKMVQVAAQELKVPVDAIFTQDTSSYQSANASPTAASSGSDLNGMAVKSACDQLNERLAPYWERYGADASMKTIAHAAYLDRVNLSATGHWKMPRIGFTWNQWDVGKNKPMYYYFTQGAVCCEAELDLLTGDHTILRTDIKMDVGRSINPAIDYGQIEGAYIQGQGMFTMEETLWTRDGLLATRGPGNYKIPGFSDIPQEFNVTFLQGVSWSHLRSIQSSKGIGEPPLFMGSAALFALRDALRSARKDNGITDHLELNSPATGERLRMHVGDELSKMGLVLPQEGERDFWVRAV
ncbi:putative xanthine dehydrogenase [Phaeomoniella chlamydospora]|uniref:Putative xanthine dehydrogenase n=1 Tax=Phaeomoniella chlamydospora TaxID=158046 RepID=A0A0G2GSE8_PHACM|nr:putative xanthine dehydrogenase [Phaeomoniella chlamydospora]